ncbi:MAG: DUF2808 domain-containing protein (plasmid) [Phormidium sp.]
MKKLIYAGVAFTLIIAASISSARAAGSLRNANAPHIVHSGSHTSNPRFLDATHHFEIHVQGPALSELSIDLPEDLSIRRGIEVENKSGQRIPATVSIRDRKATIVFSQPVPPETTLSIKMQGVNARFYRSIRQYMVYSKMVGLNAEIPLGTVRIQTSSR